MRMVLIIFHKKFCLGKMDHFEPKMVHPHNSGSAIRIFIVHNDESSNNGLYQKKNCSGQIGTSSYLWNGSKNFFKILQNERG